MSAPFSALDDGEPHANSKEDIGGSSGFSSDATRTRPSKPVVFAIPANAPAKECRSCKAKIYWYEHPRTRSKMPLNPDGTSHFATCPKAAEHRAQRSAPPAEQRSLFGGKP